MDSMGCGEKAHKMHLEFHVKMKIEGEWYTSVLKERWVWVIRTWMTTGRDEMNIRRIIDLLLVKKGMVKYVYTAKAMRGSFFNNV